jgi:hypothetical protein
MPYTMKKEGGGYKVYGPSGPKSKKPLTLRKAKAQIGLLHRKEKEE